jgi:translation initiation factor 2 subunit 2
MNYENNLDRAYERMDNNAESGEDRFNPPIPKYETDGNFTVFRNLKSTADYLNRDTRELFTFIKEELATNGSINNERGRFKGNFKGNELEEVIDEFTKRYVLCGQCNSPDTKYIERAGVETVKCTACGATKPKDKE